jgi:hypothetical protein
MLEPARAGLTNSGQPWIAMLSAMPRRSASHSRRRTVDHGATRRPACSRTAFATCLSMARALASTPSPTYGSPAISSMPWMVPSSPNGPCRIGKTMSTATVVTEPSGCSTVSARGSAALGNRTRVPLSGTTGRCWPSRAHADGSSGWSVKSPSFVMPTGTMSYAVRSTASMMPPAVTQLISCSLDRPPNRTTTVVVLVMDAPGCRVAGPVTRPGARRSR